MTATHSSVSLADIAPVIGMMRRFYAIDGYPFDTAKAGELLAEFVGNEELGKAWLIRSGDEIVGYAILTFIFSFEFKGRIAFVDELYLSEAARGKGIGRQTVAFIKSEAEKYGIRMLYLEVEHHNAIAQKLYLAAGFERHNRQFMQLKLDQP
jgi:ribosomal protein S18 acetylase RimI-like enzyme